MTGVRQPHDGRSSTSDRGRRAGAAAAPCRSCPRSPASERGPWERRRAANRAAARVDARRRTINLLARYQLSIAVSAPGCDHSARYCCFSASGNFDRSTWPEKVLSKKTSKPIASIGFVEAGHAEGVDILGRGALVRILDQALLEDDRMRRIDDRQPLSRGSPRSAAVQAIAPPQSWPTRAKRSMAERIGERENVADQLVGLVVLDILRPVGAREAALVGHDQAELGPPAAARFRARCGAIPGNHEAG